MLRLKRNINLINMQVKQGKMVTIAEYWLGLDVLRNSLGVLLGNATNAISAVLTAVIVAPLVVYLYSNWRYQDQRIFFKLPKKTYSPGANKIILRCGYTSAIATTILALLGLGAGTVNSTILGLSFVSVLAEWYYLNKTKSRFKNPERPQALEARH